MSDTSFVRREPKSAKHDARHTWVVFVVILMAIWLVAFMTPTIFRLFYLDVKSVQVDDHTIGQIPGVTVHRKIKSNFPGQFSVSIRDAEHGTFVCKTTYPNVIDYSPTANTQSPLEMSLRQWFGAAADYDECLLDRRYGPGFYFTNTCHWRELPFGFRLRRCVASAVYERRAAPE